MRLLGIDLRTSGRASSTLLTSEPSLQQPRSNLNYLLFTRHLQFQEGMPRTAHTSLSCTLVPKTGTHSQPSVEEFYCFYFRLFISVCPPPLFSLLNSGATSTFSLFAFSINLYLLGYLLCEHNNLFCVTKQYCSPHSLCTLFQIIFSFTYFLYLLNKDYME